MLKIVFDINTLSGMEKQILPYVLPSHQNVENINKSKNLSDIS